MVYGDRLMRLLAEEALCRLPSIVEGEVITPCGVSKGFVESDIQTSAVPVDPEMISPIYKISDKHTNELSSFSNDICRLILI